MSRATSDQPGQDPPAAAAGTGPNELATTDSQLLTERGTTSIADGVVQKIAGIATREISGIHNMGTGRVRTFGAVRELIPGTGGPNISQGVSVDVGRTQATVDLDIVPEYGMPVDALAVAIRRNVISMIERMTALQVVAVNIAVDDIHLPGDDDDQRSTTGAVKTTRPQPFVARKPCGGRVTCQPQGLRFSGRPRGPAPLQHRTRCPTRSGQSNAGRCPGPARRLPAAPAVRPGPRG